MNQFPSLSTMLSTYASVTTSLMLLHSILHQFLPPAARAYLTALLHRLWAPNSTLTLSFKQKSGLSENQVFQAAQLYLATIISPKTKHLSVSKILREKALTVQLEPGEKVVDTFQGVQVTWYFVEEDENKKGDNNNNNSSSGSVGLYRLCFDKKFKDLVLDSYIPYVLGRSVEIKNSQRALKIYSLGSCSSSYWVWWNSVVFEHPSTFHTLAMQPDVKKGIMEDLDRFVKRKEFYKRAGRAWKRGYLLYGPPGTGKSSLIAAMANYLKFDVYDLQLANLTSDHQLRSLMLKTANRSILVIEDIDCSMGLPTRDDPLNTTPTPTPTPTPTHSPTQKKPKLNSQVTLSGLLNFIDGLWSSCGDERIIIFTTNHKEKLDPALLRPGRMDVHIHMSYCTFECFKILANNYMEIPESYDHHLYKEIEELFGSTEVTPAQVAEELMKSEDIDVALESLLKLLKDKKMEAEEKKKKEEEEEEESKAKEDEDSKTEHKKEEDIKKAEKLKEEESKAEKLKEEESKKAEKLKEEETNAEKLKEEAARNEIYLS